VHLLRGPEPIDGDTPLLKNLFMSSRPRAFLECLQISRPQSGPSKTLAPEEIENRLDSICRIRGAGELNRLRDEARGIAKTLRMERQFEKLNAMISAILRTRPAQELSSPQARATSLGVPYDPLRLELFNRIFAHLSQFTTPVRAQREFTSEEVRIFTFFEAYFSNYIEGIEFEVSEAYDIIFRNKIPQMRPKDAHDILGTYQIVSNQQEMRKTAESCDEFLDILTFRHRTIMGARPETSPGEFKLTPNRAGETHFVDPELVRGTLSKGFELCGAVEPGLPRAIFMMFLVAEVHPFVDGNGRIARIMMNAELASVGLFRIIVPTVLRDDYLVALRALSRSDNPGPFCRVMDLAQEFSSMLNLSSYEGTVQQLTACNAFKDPDEARLRMPGVQG